MKTVLHIGGTVGAIVLGAIAIISTAAAVYHFFVTGC